MIANNCNIFKSRFDNYFNDGLSVSNELMMTMMTQSQPMIIQEREVVTVLHKIKPHKASGPDNPKGKVLKECAAQPLSCVGCFKSSRTMVLYH